MIVLFFLVFDLNSILVRKNYQTFNNLSLFNKHTTFRQKLIVMEADFDLEPNSLLFAFEIFVFFVQYTLILHQFNYFFHTFNYSSPNCHKNISHYTIESENFSFNEIENLNGSHRSV